jgi:predicted nucleotidyltransferase
MKNEQVMQQLEACAARLKSTRKEVENVCLFGSSAKDDFDLEGGADILIVLSSDGKKWEDRIPELQSFFSEVSTPVDLFPLTHDEIRRALENKDSFLGSMLECKLEIGVHHKDK